MLDPGLEMSTSHEPNAGKICKRLLDLFHSPAKKNSNGNLLSGWQILESISHSGRWTKKFPTLAGSIYLSSQLYHGLPYTVSEHRFWPLCSYDGTKRVF